MLFLSTTKKEQKLNLIYGDLIILVIKIRYVINRELTKLMMQCKVSMYLTFN